MKRTIVTMYLIGCCIFLLAQEKTINEIIDEAIECFCVYDKNCGNIDANNLEIEPIFRNGITYLYVVNTIKNGWVIVSNEKQYTQIIGHNNSGKFITDSVEMPCALRVLLNQHMNCIDSTRLEKKTIKKYTN